MTVAVPSYEVLASATQLPDAVSAAARAELTLALGRPPGPSELSALVRRADGNTWVVGYREPVTSRKELGELADRPWAHVTGMRFVTSYATIAEAAAIFNDPAAGPAEVRRRELLHDELQRELHERNKAADAQRRAESAAADQERRRQREAEEKFRIDDWGPLPPEAKLAYWLALALDDGKELAAELRRLGGELGRTHTLPFPARKWR